MPCPPRDGPSRISCYGRDTGVGGISLYSENPEEDYQWYEDTLGIKRSDSGVGIFKWRSDTDPDKRCMTIWSHINKKNNYFGDSNSNVMINYRVDDLDEFLDDLKNKRVEILGTEVSEYGKFAWIKDNQGNHLELWEPPLDNQSCY